MLEFVSLVTEIVSEDSELNDSLPLDTVYNKTTPLTHSDCWFSNGN